jgi:molybdate transport system substrate-binding protein
MKRRIRGLFIVFTVIFMATVLLFTVTQAQETQTLIVFAAASLTDAFTEIGAAFEAENPGVDVVFSFGGSSQLAAQLAEGAPVDVFASASASQMTVAVEAGRIAGTPETFVKNRLVLITPADNPASITGLADLANDGIALVVAAPAVPVREYTDTMLTKMAAYPGYGETYREAVIANIVSEEDNVRQVAAKVALGEADAGIVYLSDVTPDIADDVLTFPIPDAFNTIATYPIAVTDDGENPEIAGAFVDYVLSDDGQAILASWNFVPVTETTDEDASPVVQASPAPCRSR